MVERNRLEIRIDRRKTTSDIDDVDRDRRADNGGTHPFQGVDIGERRHRLAADVEADAEAVCPLPRPLQQFSRLIDIDAEF